MAFYLSPISVILQYFTDTGVILSGGKVNTYLAGTSTPTATWTDSTGITPNSNPIVLASNGRLPNVQVWQQTGVNIKIIITDANNNQLGPTFDQISGVNDPAALLSVLDNPASGSGADLVANAVRSYDLFTSLRAANLPSLAAGQTLVVDVQAGIAPNDGLGGLFYWNATSTATDDGADVIKPTAFGGAGRYLRQIASSAGTFTGTLTGMTVTLTATVSYRVYNNSVFLFFQGAGPTGTSNNINMTMTGIPAALRPIQARAVPTNCTDNGQTYAAALGIIDAGGVITFQKLSGNFYSNGAFTGSGSKGLFGDWVFSYPLS
jgi:hypothetical protein